MKISCFKACGANGPTSQGFLLSDVREGGVARRHVFQAAVLLLSVTPSLGPWARSWQGFRASSLTPLPHPQNGGTNSTCLIESL